MNDWNDMLDEILNDETDRMTAWEVEFIESLHKQRERGCSDKQFSVLEKIWNKLFGGTK